MKARIGRRFNLFYFNVFILVISSLGMIIYLFIYIFFHFVFLIKLITSPFLSTHVLIFNFWFFFFSFYCHVFHHVHNRPDPFVNVFIINYLGPNFCKMLYLRNILEGGFLAEGWSLRRVTFNVGHPPLYNEMRNFNPPGQRSLIWGGVFLSRTVPCA